MTGDFPKDMSLDDKRKRVVHEAAKIRGSVRERVQDWYHKDDGTFDRFRASPKRAIPDLIKAGVAWAEVGLYLT